jgi:hypothetical protein
MTPMLMASDASIAGDAVASAEGWREAPGKAAGVLVGAPHPGAGWAPGGWKPPGAPG